jgi:aminomethyltransferase
MVVRNASGDYIGIVTSGTFSPTLHQGIALALVNADVDGDVVVDVRGRSLPCTIVKPPFVTASPKA